MRHRRYLAQLEAEGLDGFLLKNPCNIFYLFGLQASAGLALCLDGDFQLIVDSRYLEIARSTVRNAEVRPAPNSLEDTLQDVLGEIQGRRIIGFDGHFLSQLSASQLPRLPQGGEWRAAQDPAVRLRRVKAPQEITRLKNAIGRAQRAFAQARGLFGAEMPETEIAGCLEAELRRQGAEGYAFETIVASGPNSSKPHAVPGPRRWNGTEPLLVDFGIRLAGYCSDLTRMLPDESRESEYLKVRSIVARAREKALQLIRPGAKACQIDAAARNWIAESGYGGSFGHGLGHGLGIEVHEEPRVGRTSTDVLEEGMVFTVEPGIYLPGRFGVRLEDVVVVTSDGFEFLSDHQA